LKLLVPKGYCALDPSHPADASVISLWQKTFAPGIDQLVGAAVECSQLEAWRNPPLLLVDFTQALTILAPQYETMPYDERTRVPASLCNTVRQQIGQMPSEPRAKLEAKVTAALATLTTGQSKLIGVIDEEPAACYVVVVARAQTVSGAPASVLDVRATVVLKGRVLHFYQTAHSSNGKELAALTRASGVLKEHIQAHLAANRN
jgi:hypothetical protein